MNDYLKLFYKGNIVICSNGDEELMRLFLSEADFNTDNEMETVKRGIKAYKNKASFRFSSYRMHFAPKDYYENNGYKVIDLQDIFDSADKSIEENEIMSLFM